MFQSHDTIVAISSAVGSAARMIVRLSGSQAIHIAGQVTCGDLQGVVHAPLRFSTFEIGAWIYTFHAPRSYSGEDTVEFHIPGNPLLARLLLESLISLGARSAEAGEFTARAYFNGRIDLSQAEGVAATIASSSAGELRAARQLLAGELARRVNPALQSLADTLALVEVGIDFSEEDVGLPTAEQLRGGIIDIDTTLADLARDNDRLERMSHTPRLVLVGRPNAGKSTLLNALAGDPRAVVSSQAGTTRDALSATVTLARGEVELIDVAGLDGSTREDFIESQMRSRAFAAIAQADRLVLVRDGSTAEPPPPLSREPDLIVITKADKPRQGPAAGDVIGDVIGDVTVSAHSGEGMEALRFKLDEIAFAKANGGLLALNARHLLAIHRSRQSLQRAIERVSANTAELLAIELRDALDALGEIVGQVSPDDVLGRIFAGFCIGK